MKHLTEGELRIIRRFRRTYLLVAFLVCLAMAAVLILTVAELPGFGQEGNPAENEVTRRYLEKGVEETGAINIVAAVILDYRAFDTLGESLVLFLALMAVLLLLREDQGRFVRRYEERKPHEPAEDQIFGVISRFLVPCIFLFGVYIILNGHLSPGGGFSGGAALGAGLILYNLAFGLENTRRFLAEKQFFYLMGAALLFYTVAKGYSFFTGGNHLPGSLPLGQPGSIFSGGLILPLNIVVGIVVACTVYGIFALFNRGGL